MDCAKLSSSPAKNRSRARSHAGAVSNARRTSISRLTSRSRSSSGRSKEPMWVPGEINSMLMANIATSTDEMIVPAREKAERAAEGASEATGRVELSRLGSLGVGGGRPSEGVVVISGGSITSASRNCSVPGIDGWHRASRGLS